MKPRFPSLYIEVWFCKFEPKCHNFVRVSSLLCLNYVLFKQNNINQMQHYFLKKLLVFIMVPPIQRTVDIFKDNVWNIHPIRDQKGVHLPSDAPNHIYNFPEEYNLLQCGKIWECGIIIVLRLHIWYRVPLESDCLSS